jgi:hypothetical protein
VTLRTSYEFVLPRGYVDSSGAVHKVGQMRLATARDELEPLRDPTVTGPDDPRLTVLVLARVVERLGTLDLITPHEIEGLFAADLAFLQDFYGVINFGNQEEYEALLRAQQDTPPPPVPVSAAELQQQSAAARPEPVREDQPSVGQPPGQAQQAPDAAAASQPDGRPAPRRSLIEEIPTGTR